MTLKVTANGKNLSLGPNPGLLKTPDGIEVCYEGDNTGEVQVNDHNGASLGKFTMSTIGFSTEIEYKVYVAPIERYEPTAEVTRFIGLERM